MSSPLLHISTDLPTYGPTDDVKVTATIDKWWPGLPQQHTNK